MENRKLFFEPHFLKMQFPILFEEPLFSVLESTLGAVVNEAVICSLKKIKKEPDSFEFFVKAADSKFCKKFCFFVYLRYGKEGNFDFSIWPVRFGVRQVYRYRPTEYGGRAVRLYLSKETKEKQNFNGV